MRDRTKNMKPDNGFIRQTVKGKFPEGGYPKSGLHQYMELAMATTDTNCLVHLTHLKSYHSNIISNSSREK